MKQRLAVTLLGTILSVCGVAQMAAAQNSATANRLSSASCMSGSSMASITVRARQQGIPWLSLCDGVAQSTHFNSASGSVSLEGAQPRALASGDFDSDGMPDLVSGFAAGHRGIITVHRGNVDALWPYGAALRNGPPPAFLPGARSFPIPEFPDFLATGDFDADGRWDVVTAQLGSNALYLLRGDGRGGFAAPERITLPGNVTAMIAGEINRADGLADLIIGVKNATGAHVLVFESPLGALRGPPESFTVAHPVATLALGRFDDGAMNDLAVGAGNQIVVIHGRDRMLSLSEEQRAKVGAARVTTQNFPYEIQALAAGDFTGAGPSIAVLGSDASVHILDHALTPSSLGAEALDKFSDPNLLPAFETAKPGADGKPVIVNGRRTPAMEARIYALRLAMKAGARAAEWTERSVVALPPGFAQAIPRLVAARVAGSSREEILVADSGNSKLHILSTRTSAIKVPALTRAGTAPVPEQMRLLTSLDAASAPAAVLPMRLNRHGLSSLVLLQAGQAEPTVIQQDIPASNIFTVTNTQDLTTTSVPVPDGPAGSLRAAINAANSATGPALIQFDIPTSDPGYNSATGIWTIRPISSGTVAELLTFALPYISNTITIDGYSQPGASPNTSTTTDNARILIQIDGSLSTTPGNDGLEPFDDSGTVIRGLAFTGWTDAYDNNGGSSGACGVEAFGVGDFVEGNFTGTDATGKNAGPNRIGVFVDNGPGFGEGSGTIVGGTTPQARNLASGNSIAGVLVLATADQSQVQGNFIGTDITGSNVLSNGTDGAGTNGSTITFGGAVPGAGNLIAGNPTNVDLNDLTDEGYASSSLVQGNLIGTDGTGTKSQTFAGTGVSILNNPEYMTIGGTTPAARNVISGNAIGLYVFDNAYYNNIQGNYIGTDITGTVALGNATYGYESGSVAETTDGVAGTDVPAGLNNIGGAVPGAGNIISGNGQDGINISGTSNNPADLPAYLGNTIQGNFIGTDHTGTQPIPNQGNGVYLLAGATNNIIGGTAPGAGNLIAFNKQNGVLIDPGTGADGPGTGNNTIANTILSNSGAGVRINTGTQEMISKNSIFGNGDLGINLDGLGANLNTNCNATATGPNNSQNAPVLTTGTGAAFISATATDPNGNTSEFSNSVPESLSGNLLDLLGTFNGVANTAYTIEFFSSPSADASGYGQGKTYIGSTTVTTGSSCTAPVSDPVNLTEADVSVTLAGNYFGLQAGADFGQESYTGTITNIGPAIAHNVVFKDMLPAGLTISSAYCNLGSCQSPVTTSFGNCTVSSNIITCNLGTMAPGTTSTVNIPVQVTGSGSITNTATVNATEVDPVLANNTSSVTEGVTYPSPLIDHLDPASALADSPNDVVLTIYGYWLLPESTVTFNGNPVSNVAFLDNQGCGFDQAQYCSALQVLVPASMLTTAGTPNVVVSNPNPAPYGETDYPSTATFTIAASCTFSNFSLFPTPPDTLDSGGSNLLAEFVEVTASAPTCPWTATSTVPWAVVLDNASATGSQTVDISIAPNTGSTSRSGSVTVAGQTIDFTQDPGSSCGYDLSPASAALTPAGGAETIAVTSGCFGYYVVSYAPWITIAQDSSLLVDNATVTYTVAPNTGGPRSGYLVVGGQAFLVTQSGASCYFTLSANSTTLPITGGTGSVGVTASAPSCAWTATTPASSPIKITSGASGTGNGTVNFSVAANAGAALTSAITIGNQSGGSSVFSVNQPSAFSCTFTISPTQVSIPSNGAASTVTVTASYQNCQWSAATSDSTALTLPNSSTGTGDGAVMYVVGQNTGPARTLTITAGCQTFTINQSGAQVSNPVPAITTLSPSSATAGSGAFTLTVNGTGFISSSVVNFNGSTRVTTYVSPTQLTAAILASDITSAGTPSITVTNPTPGGGTSNAVAFNVAAANNPTPAITTLSPSSATADSGAFTLTVNGTGFISSSVVNFNGNARVTTYVSATQLTAAILASDITSAGTPSVSVTNPTPGGGTSNAVAFNITAAAAPAATLTPASLAFTSVSGVTTAAQTATLSNTGTAPLAISGISITGANPSDFAQTNACGSSLAAGSSCSISVTFTPESTGNFAATLTVTDNAAGSPQTVSLTGVGSAAPSFTLSSSSGSQSIKPTGSATYTITVTPANGAFTAPITLSATTLPPGATASFTPSSITPGSSPANSTLVIQTAVAAAKASALHWPAAAPLLALLCLFFLPGKRRRWITQAVLLVAALGAFGALTACGGGFGFQSPARTYTITVTGTSGAIQQSTTVQLTVQ